MIKKKFKSFIFILILLFSNNPHGKEVLIYADSITYDKEKNIIAKGKAKIIEGNQILTSDLIIYNQVDNEYTIPLNFSFKDSNGNYYSGSKAIFSQDLNNAEITDVRILLSDGSRIVGKSAIKKNEIDIISKGSYSPCKSRINIKDFKCPIWQVDGEKILHDNKNLFLHQKHSKIKIFNVPVFYLPYLATPSPLRKKRKSGFLTPSINFNFLDTKISQSTSFPYYFNIDIDKELTFTPVINYGGGVNSSQRFILDYNQIISGGTLGVDLTFDTTFEKENNEDWIKDASIITNYDYNINEKFNINIKTALQTSKTYLQTSSPSNELSNVTSLSSTLNLKGYNLNNNNDYLLFNISSYQVTQSNIDNKTTPTTLPYIYYRDGNKKIGSYEYENIFNYYNIFREKGTLDHSQKQQKITHQINIKKEFIRFKSKIKLISALHNQFFSVEKKKINDDDFTNEFSGNYIRSFPMSGISIETPIRFNKNLYITPKSSIILNSSQSNSNKISNEDATNNQYTIFNQQMLNRYTGTDKLDNSQRFLYGINMLYKKFEINFSQNYEFNKHSNYHNESGNNDYLSDALFDINYNTKKTLAIYNIRYDPNREKIKKQTITINNDNKFVDLSISYLDEKKETNSILSDGNETMNINIKSKKFKKFSSMNITSKYDLILDNINEYTVGYNYYDECFGVNLDFGRKYYENELLKPSDTLTLMFSFKNLGSYKSTNLAVSETDKQDIEWFTESVSNDKFN